MSLKYTVDVFCDGDGCNAWTHGITDVRSRGKWPARMKAWQNDRFVQIKNKDYCPACAAIVRAAAEIGRAMPACGGSEGVA